MFKEKEKEEEEEEVRTKTNKLPRQLKKSNSVSATNLSLWLAF